MVASGVFPLYSTSYHDVHQTPAFYQQLVGVVCSLLDHELVDNDKVLNFTTDHELVDNSDTVLNFKTDHELVDNDTVLNFTTLLI